MKETISKSTEIEAHIGQVAYRNRWRQAA